jgi:hypothetical protein
MGAFLLRWLNTAVIGETHASAFERLPDYLERGTVGRFSAFDPDYRPEANARLLGEVFYCPFEDGARRPALNVGDHVELINLFTIDSKEDCRPILY